MNTLANHGYIPRNGRDITLETAVYALTTAISFDKESSVALWRHGVKANPAGGNSSSFTLEDLGKHNLIEHDASMRYVHNLELSWLPQYWYTAKVEQMHTLAIAQSSTKQSLTLQKHSGQPRIWLCLCLQEQTTIAKSNPQLTTLSIHSTLALRALASEQYPLFFWSLATSLLPRSIEHFLHLSLVSSEVELGRTARTENIWIWPDVWYRKRETTVWTWLEEASKPHHLDTAGSNVLIDQNWGKYDNCFRFRAEHGSWCFQFMIWLSQVCQKMVSRLRRRRVL